MEGKSACTITQETSAFYVRIAKFFFFSSSVCFTQEFGGEKERWQSIKKLSEKVGEG